MIPEEKNDAVKRALHETFGVTEYEDIRAITKGNSTNRVYRIEVRGVPYLLRLILRKDSAERHYANMRAAADAGLAPRVWYTNVEDKVSITDFLETVPLAIEEAPVLMGATLRKLHALPPFAPVPPRINTTCTFLLHQGPHLDGFLQSFQAANLAPKHECDEVLARFQQLSSAYVPRDADMVSSHNDLFKPDNILFDGRRVWLIDWEAAFLNDRYADLAVVANQVIENDSQERAFLREYFGRDAEEDERARLSLMRQVSHVFYALGFLLIGSGGQAVDWSRKAPDFREFNRRFWSGEVELKDREMKIAFARAHWDQVLLARGLEEAQQA